MTAKRSRLRPRHPRHSQPSYHTHGAVYVHAVHDIRNRHVNQTEPLASTTSTTSTTSTAFLVAPEPVCAREGRSPFLLSLLPPTNYTSLVAGKGEGGGIPFRRGKKKRGREQLAPGVPNKNEISPYERHAMFFFLSKTFIANANVVHCYRFVSQHTCVVLAHWKRLRFDQRRKKGRGKARGGGGRGGGWREGEKKLTQLWQGIDPSQSGLGRQAGRGGGRREEAGSPPLRRRRHGRRPSAPGAMARGEGMYNYSII